LGDCGRQRPQVIDVPYRTTNARPFVPTEFHVSTTKDENGPLGILSIQTTEGILNVALDGHAADTIAKAINQIRSEMDAESS